MTPSARKDGKENGTPDDPEGGPTAERRQPRASTMGVDSGRPRRCRGTVTRSTVVPSSAPPFLPPVDAMELEPRADRPSRRAPIVVVGLFSLFTVLGCGGEEPAPDPSAGETAPAAEAAEGQDADAPNASEPVLRTPAREELPEAFLASVAGKGRTFVFFHARSWDPASRELFPVVDRIETEHPNLVVVRVNVDEEQDVARAYRVPGVPVAAILEGIEPVAVLVDSVTSESLRRFAAQAP